MTLTLEEQACNFHTMRHIERVRNLINVAVLTLLKRGEKHDQSKLESPEVELFTEHTPKLAGLDFTRPEYQESLKKIDYALQHHYANNRHHPQHFKNGVNDMNLIDLIEMFIDCKAGSERQHNGNIKKSIEKLTNDFQFSPQLAKIFENTIAVFEE